jgi:tetratricopeptide (TPR) repeat protein
MHLIAWSLLLIAGLVPAIGAAPLNARASIRETAAGPQAMASSPNNGMKFSPSPGGESEARGAKPVGVRAKAPFACDRLIETSEASALTLPSPAGRGFNSSTALSSPSGIEATLNLAQDLLQRNRTSREPAEAERVRGLIRQALASSPLNAQAWTLSAWDEMNRHRFRTALDAAERAHRLAAPTALSLGLQADALVELGRYREAVAVTQQMVDRFPGLPAVSRAAHLRWLHGDADGAIALLEPALRAPPTGSEPHAWALLQKTEIELNGGRIEPAERSLQRAETLFPGKPEATALRARLLEARGDGHRALLQWQDSLAGYPSPDSAVAAWRLARRIGDGAAAQRLERLLEGLAQLDARGDPLFRRSLAEYYAIKEPAGSRAESLARQELAQRPDIYGHGLLAFVLRQSGQAAQAGRHARLALRLGTPDPRLRHWAAGTDSDTIATARQLAGRLP